MRKMDGKRFPERRHPAHGLRVSASLPTLVYVTVCTQGRGRWLAFDDVHSRLVQAWKEATAWSVGRYVVLPEHVHLFAAPGSPELPLENWMRFWKTRFHKLHGGIEHRLQSDHWDTRIRSVSAYDSKWEYVRSNPVRHGLVERAEDWPFQGELNHLAW